MRHTAGPAPFLKNDVSSSFPVSPLPFLSSLPLPVALFPGLYPRAVSSIPPSYNNKKCLLTLSNVPWGAKLPRVEKHCFKLLRSEPVLPTRKKNIWTTKRECGFKQILPTENYFFKHGFYNFTNIVVLIFGILNFC